MRPADAQNAQMRTLSGTLNLDGVQYHAPYPLTRIGMTDYLAYFTFEFASTTAPVTFSLSVPVQPNGAFAVTNIPPDNYTLRIKGFKWLRAATTVDVRAGDVTNLTMTLPNGDADNSNVVDVGDFGVLVNAYGATYDSSDPNNRYDICADFTCDGHVDIADFGILTSNSLELGGLYEIGLSADNSVPEQITVSWALPENGPTPTNLTYNLYRSTSPAHGQHPYKTNLTGMSFTDTDVTPGVTYYYQVISAGTQDAGTPTAHSVFGLSNEAWATVLSTADNGTAPVISGSDPYYITGYQSPGQPLY